jgi:hypothetical protein
MPDDKSRVADAQELMALEPKSAEGGRAVATPEGGRHNNREKRKIELDSLRSGGEKNSYQMEDDGAD